MGIPIVTTNKNDFNLELERNGVAIFDCNSLITEFETMTNVAASAPWLLLCPESGSQATCLATLSPTKIKMKKDAWGNVHPVTRPSRTPDKVGKQSEHKVTNQTIDHCHIDGADAYDYTHPDYIFLLCEVESEVGGENFCIDLKQILNEIKNSSNESVNWVADDLFCRNVIQRYAAVTADRIKEIVGPLAMKTSQDRLIFTCPNVFAGDYERIAPSLEVKCNAEIKKTKHMIEVFSDHLRTSQAKAERFKLSKGHLLCVDNYRMAHGREPYVDLDRTLWRTWCWTNRSNGLPEGVFAGRNHFKDNEA